MVIVIFLFFLVCSAFFSGSETALLSMNKFLLAKIEQTEPRSAERLLELLSKPKRLFFSILMGNTLVNIALTACVTSIAVNFFEQNAVAIAITVTFICLILFGEILPKTFASLFSVEVAKKASFPLKFVIWLLSPFVSVLLTITNKIITHLGGIVPQDSAEISDKEIKSMIEIGHRQGVVEYDEREMIYGVFDFKDLKASDVMTPKPDIMAIDLESTKKEIFSYVRKAHHSRLPVYKTSMDNILGILHAKDALLNPDKDIYKIMKSPYCVPESICIDQLLLNLQKKCIQMAIVVNEYGITTGIITIEDILEEIVGEIVDEYDIEQPKIVKIDDNTYKISGLLNINEANDEFDLGIDTAEIDTMGGFISMRMQKIPEEGEEVIYKNWSFKAIKIEKRRVKEILMKRI
ncbi:MAG: hemolysin family protein [Candidatus Omnitrophica bacterium]|nr:hemolysin family protein [Candidatus Omnitrophota bacterium]